MKLLPMKLVMNLPMNRAQQEGFLDSGQGSSRVVMKNPSTVAIGVASHKIKVWQGIFGYHFHCQYHHQHPNHSCHYTIHEHHQAYLLFVKSSKD